MDMHEALQEQVRLWIMNDYDEYTNAQRIIDESHDLVEAGDRLAKYYQDYLAECYDAMEAQTRAHIARITGRTPEGNVNMSTAHLMVQTLLELAYGYIDWRAIADDVKPENWQPTPRGYTCWVCGRFTQNWRSNRWYSETVCKYCHEHDEPQG